MDPTDCVLTVITPTVGRPGLDRLIGSIAVQTIGPVIYHLLLWDDHRDHRARPIRDYEDRRRLVLRLSDGMGRNGRAPGSPLRAVGLMAAPTPWVTLADDDVVWDPEHAARILAAAEGLNWASTLRRVVTADGEVLGTDRFQSVGDDPSRRVPREMCDGNTMVFRRRFGVMAAPLFRETTAYDDDRRLYAFLKRYAGPRGRTGKATLTQTCPERLTPLFRANCTRS
jgi:hypothetical protein